jgi:FMN phosphatase YigB (HAD superfamily)
MNKRKISLLITDLDNTVYDWITAFVPSLYAMVRTASPILHVDENVLLDELQDVHQRHKDTEHPFALLETKTVVEFARNNPSFDIRKVLDPAFHAFNRLRKEKLKVYETVLESLYTLQKANIPVVAYTDARIVSSIFRINLLNIRMYFTELYAPRHHADINLPDQEYSNFVRLLDSTDRKPYEKTLIDICAAFSVSPQHTLYIGDSIMRDVYMAHKAGVNSAWARYGTIYDSGFWPQLVRVTHWTSEDFKREAALKVQSRGIDPDCILDRFADIFKYYEFRCLSTPDLSAADGAIRGEAAV